MDLTSIRRRVASAPWPRLKRRREPRPERAPQPPVPAALSGPLRAFRAAALWAIAILVATADGAAFSESYRGLFEWAQHHLLSGFWAAAFPFQVDLFIVVGELVLFIAMADRWGWRDRLGAWSVALLGLAVSVAGNIGHVAAHDLQTRGTAAVPPVAAFGALWLGLGVLKRVLRRSRATAETVAQVAQQAASQKAETTRLSEVLDGLTDAFLLLARRETEPVAAPDHSALLGEILAAVQELARPPAGELPAPVAGDTESAAVASYRATVLAGNPWSQRQLETRFELTRAQASRVRDQVHAELDSAAPEPIRYAELNGASA
jgi:hypothetical protein